MFAQGSLTKLLSHYLPSGHFSRWKKLAPGFG